MLETMSRRTRSRARHRQRRTRRWRGLIGLVVLVALLGGVALAGLRYYESCQEAPGGSRNVTVTIEKGASGNTVIDQLAEEGLVKCPLVAKWIVRQRGVAEDFQARTFTLSTSWDLDRILEEITTPPPPIQTVSVTIPEGYRLTEIAERLAGIEGVDMKARRVLKLATGGTFSLPPYLPEDTETLEGFLFPKSYEWVKELVTPRYAIEQMLAQFEEEVADLPWNKARRLGVSEYEIVIIASMIEREVRVDEERELVAAVIYNRLAEGMPLGIDATLQYIDPNPDDGLTGADLEIDSPYNTRKFAGLPPTPIGSPRLESIRAALEPADVPYLYYVLCEKDGPGTHRFSVEYDEFLRNRNECLG
ncbi:MAG: endolytic transglycosylase MltG [Actinobacteria bacterium]|nr:endolytic transglycosylase MltG [Actinomycetota bacterium]